MSGNPLSEIEASLIQRAAHGDREAFGNLYDRMFPRVLGLARRVLRDAGQAEEVAQEVFLEVWQLADRFDESKGTGAGWILRKAHSRSVDRVRSAQAGSVRDLRMGLRELSEPSADVVEVVELRIDSERIDRALRHLPTPQREAVTLAHLDGYSHREVSAILRIPVGTVKTRIRAGMGRLREELAIA